MAAIGSAQGYNTIDVVHKWLCRVNVNTGLVQHIGPETIWGEPAYDFGYQSETTSHLGFHQGTLHAVTHWKIGWSHKIAVVECNGPTAGQQVGGIFVAVPHNSGYAKNGGLDAAHHEGRGQ